MDKRIEQYIAHLKEDEKAKATCEQYKRELKRFSSFCKDKELSKETMLAYKEDLIAHYKTSSANAALVAINGFLSFIQRQDLRLKLFKLQRSVFLPQSTEMTKEEYTRLIKTARKKNDERLALLIETICSTGIRVSEVQYITTEALSNGEAVVRMKGKTRKIFLPDKLITTLKKYTNRHNIHHGPIFITRSGNPLDRSNIWKMMKALCKEALVESTKVFPHSLRHLFARTFYAMDKDIARLADILGHSSINTTRIYIMSTGVEHRKLINSLNLL